MPETSSMCPQATTTHGLCWNLQAIDEVTMCCIVYPIVVRTEEKRAVTYYHGNGSCDLWAASNSSLKFTVRFLHSRTFQGVTIPKNILIHEHGFRCSEVLFVLILYVGLVSEVENQKCHIHCQVRSQCNILEGINIHVLLKPCLKIQHW